MVVQAVEKDLAELRKRDPALADSAIAAMALAMASEIDDYENSATSKSMCANRLQEAMSELRELAPKAEAKDDLDDLAARRAKRRAG